MPPSAQNLYFHLGLHADDDGVVDAHTVIKITDSKPDDFHILASKHFIFPLNQDLIVVILDWREHNLIRADRKIDSIYQDLLLEKLPDIELLQKRDRADVKKLSGRPVDNQWSAQVRLGKVRLGKVSKNTSAAKTPHVGVEKPKPDMTPLPKSDVRAYWVQILEEEKKNIGLRVVARFFLHKGDKFGFQDETRSQLQEKIRSNIRAGSKCAVYDKVKIENGIEKVLCSQIGAEARVETLYKTLTK